VASWRLIAGLGLSQIIGWGTTYYALGTLAEPIMAETGWSRTFVFSAFSAALLLTGLVSPVAGRMSDRHGARPIMVWGSLLSVLGLVLLAWSPNQIIYVVAWLILGPAMRLALYDAAFTALAQIAGPGARRAISYLTLFGGLASTVFWPAGHWLSQQFGLSAAFLIYAALHLFICLPLHWVLLSQSRDTEEPVEGPTAESTGLLEDSKRKFAAILFSLVLATNGIVFAAMSAHFVSLFTALGIATGTAVSIAALKGPFQVAGRIGEILFGKSLNALYLGVVATALLPAAFAILWLGGVSATTGFLFAAVYGVSNGVVTIVRGSVPLALFGSKGYGGTLGMIVGPQLVLSAAAPAVFSWILDRGGAYTFLSITTAFAIISLTIMVILAIKARSAG
jgi:MFS family permease